MKYATLLLAFSVTSLIACGQSEDTRPAPAADAAPPAAPVQQTEPVPVTAAEPEVPTAPAPTLPPPSPPAVQPAAASEPVPQQQTTSAAPAATGNPAPDLAHGQQIYRQACAFCHDKGVAGAPKVGDAEAWSPRLAQGLETLYRVSLNGKGAMPAKGGNPALADSDVKAAVDFIVAQSR